MRSTMSEYWNSAPSGPSGPRITTPPTCMGDPASSAYRNAASVSESRSVIPPWWHSGTVPIQARPAGAQWWRSDGEAVGEGRGGLGAGGRTDTGPAPDAPGTEPAAEPTPDPHRNRPGTTRRPNRHRTRTGTTRERHG